MIQHHDVDVGDGLRLHAAESGEGRALVLLHGFTGSTEMWSPLRAVAEKTHRVVAVDFAGHGRSGSPADAQRYSLARFSDDLVRILDELSIERASLLGYSMGGRAALRFALGHQDRLDCLILESTSPGMSDAEARGARIVLDDSLAESIEQNGIEWFVAKWEAMPIWATQRALPPERIAALRAQRLANRSEGLANSLRGAGAGLDEPLQSRLAEIEVPALLIAGEWDEKYIELGRSIKRALPLAQLSVIPEAGHAVHFEQPEAFATAVMQFLLGC